MPELPEVETIRRGIEPIVINQKITNTTIRHHQLRWPIPKNLPNKLKNQSISKILRRGKYLLFTLNNGTLIIHLGMSGSLQILPKEQPLKKHDHVDIIFSNNQCLRFNDPRRFGAIIWTEQGPLKHKLLVNLGPEPFSKSFNTEYLLAKITNRKSPIKNIIMDSKIVTGVGNIYASEALFLARINPKKIANKLTLEDCKQLVSAIKQILKAAIEHGGTTFRDYKNSQGEKGLFKEKLQVYVRTNLPCNHCGTKIREIKIGQRSSYCCPKCQI